MNCDRFSGYIERYLDKDLEEKISLSFEQHLESCKQCSRELEFSEYFHDVGGLCNVLKEATDYLVPLSKFRGEPKFEPLFCGDRNNWDYILIECYLNGEFIETNSLFRKYSLFGSGSLVGDFLYESLNPRNSIMIKDMTYRKFKELKEGFLDEVFSIPQLDSELNLCNLHIRLGKIIAYCCGFAFLDYKGVKEEPVKEERKILSELEREYSQPEFFINMKKEGLFSLEIAENLYSKKGSNIVAELIPLSFKQARSRILDYTKKDISCNLGL